ncbi:MAG TPA: serine hydrolase domain-containing protein [Beijerinckiaceae bacterium]|nr:serine hydrolase domain-containing protein [Beijerinckiaceae bacterium]
MDQAVRTTETARAIADPSGLGLSESGLARLRRVLTREIERKRLPGAVAMIARQGKLGFLEAFGVQDPASGAPMQIDSIFRIYSMTKPVVSVAIMMLVEEGRLFLADPLSKYVPAFADPKVAVERDGRVELVPAERPITIQDLLRHTSGLTYEFVGTAAVQRMYLDKKLPSTDQTNADQVERLASLPLFSQPGKQWDYSRSTDVLGRIIEIVSGETLGEFLRQRIFAPLGMSDTGFHVPTEKQSRIAEPFAKDPDSGEAVRLLDIRRPARFESGGGGLVSTLPDYARFLDMLAAGGTCEGQRLLARKTIDLMRSDHLGPNVRRGSELLQPGHGFGLGFAVRTESGMSVMPGSVGLYFWGGIAGTTFWIDPKEELYAMMLVQAPGQRDYYRALFRTLVYGALE